MNAPTQNMPRYKSHKEVHALKIAGVGPDGPIEEGRGWITPVGDEHDGFSVSAEYMGKHNPRVGGYYVVYEDGYKSFSPAEAFESGYTAMQGG